jgi:hypothetical protein
MIPTNVEQVSNNLGNTHQRTNFDSKNAYFTLTQTLILIHVDIT